MKKPKKKQMTVKGNGTKLGREIVFEQNKEKISVIDENQSVVVIIKWKQEKGFLIQWVYREVMAEGSKDEGHNSGYNKQNQSMFEVKRWRSGEGFLIENWTQSVGADEL